jgi:hypothetical protein
VRRAKFPLLLALGLLTQSCSGDLIEAPRRAPSGAQCLEQLSRMPNVRYRMVPRRAAAPGCSLAGTVQLLDIGVPVAGLGPVSCPVAVSLVRWLHEDVQPAAKRRLGATVVRVETFGSYSCRPRNNRVGAAPSEHSTANAVDVSAFRLSNGRRLPVTAWTSGLADERGFLRDVHGAACRRFAVVLGPEANALHRDHLHLDMGRSRACR